MQGAKSLAAATLALLLVFSVLGNSNSAPQVTRYNEQGCCCMHAGLTLCLSFFFFSSPFSFLFFFSLSSTPHPLEDWDVIIY